MALEATCPACGRPVKHVEVEGEVILLDTIPSLDGLFRLDPNDFSKAERITRPGHQGFKPHSDTCSAVSGR